MRALFCIICPPMGVLLCGRPISAIFNMFLCLFFWVPGMMHAFTIHNDTHMTKQTRRIVKAIGKGSKKRDQLCRVQLTAPPPRLIDHAKIGERGTRFKRRRA